MKIAPVEGYDKDRVPVFLVNEGFKIERHPFFKFLTRQDKDYLIAFQKKSPIKDAHNHLVFLPSGGEAFLLGLPVRQKFNHRKAILAARRIVWVARRERVKNIVVNFDDLIAADETKDKQLAAEVIATQFEIANFEFINYKTAPPEGWFFVQGVHVNAPGNRKTFAEALRRGQIIGEEINKARALSNMPAGDLHPVSFAKEVEKIGKECGFEVKVLGRAEMEKLGMGGVVGVGRGSIHEPKFVIAEYWGGRKKEKPVALVGKGVTFDAGGLNLKPEQSIYEMHMDMSGGASVMHTIATCARLGIKKNIIGLVPVVENMPSGSSYHPGDLLRTMSGKTIEVLNTDAEGRVILADALTYAQKYNPSLVIDIATLTGAAEVALGQRASAIFTTSSELEKKFRALGELTGDIVWPLPLWEEYEDEIKGTFGDWANLGKTRYGGAIVGAVFLWQFIKPMPWVHIDIAPRMISIDGEFLAKGSAGPAVNLLTHFIKNQ